MASASASPFAQHEDQFVRLLIAVDELRQLEGSISDEEWQTKASRERKFYLGLPDGLFWEWLSQSHDSNRLSEGLYEFTNQFFRPIEEGNDESTVESAAKSSEGAAQKKSSVKTADLTPEEIAEQRIQECLATSSARLDLSDLGLTRLPDAIGRLTHIKELHLDSNELTELPEAIGNLTNLRALFVSRNRLGSLPTTIGALTKLTVLNLHYNQLEELPHTIGELISLEKLRLEGNNLQSLPTELAEIPKLGLIFVDKTDISRDSLLRDGWPQSALNHVKFEDQDADPDRPTPPIPDERNKQPPLRTHSDTATAEDQLGRAPAAEALAARMNLIWQRHAKAQHTDPLVMHLNAPWGAGKTSYFLLLKKLLMNPTEGEGWAVVEMNAWQHQHVGAPWWSLFQIIYQKAQAQTNTPSAEQGMIWRENWRRFHGRKMPFFVGLSITALGLTVLFNGGPGGEVLDILFPGEMSTSAGAAAITQIFLGFPVAVAGIIKSLNHFRETLLPADADTAERWTSIHKDPRNQLKKHFQGLVDDLGKPLLVFIDDLDRCQPKYVVELLEHIMTIFRHNQVFFMVAADGQWITRCFELEYKDFKDYHSDPGRSLGHHFLEKVFQFSIPLPQPSKELRDAFWEMLTQPALQEEESADQGPKPATSDEGDESDRKKARRQRQEKIEAFVRKSSEATSVFAKEDTEESIQSFLGPFSKLVENNPRAMKRLVNAYIVQAIAETARHGRELEEEEQVRLARWTILQHRYPILIDYFRSNPQKIAPAIAHKAGSDAANFKDDERVQAILEQANKINSILTQRRTGQKTSIELKAKDIATYLGVDIETGSPAPS